MKIIFLGDSLTWGGYGGDFVAEVARQMPDHDIINAGQVGNTVLSLLRRLDRVLSQKPDGIFVMVGGNDAISRTQPATRPYYEQTQKVPGGIVTPDQFAQTYRDLLLQIHARHVLAWVGLAPVEYSRELVDTLREYHTLAQEAGEAQGVPVLDLMAAFPPPADIPERPPLDMDTINLIARRTREGWSDYEAEQTRGGFSLTFDGLHLTPATAKQMGAQIARFLAEQI